MTCEHCCEDNCKRFGKDRNGNQRWRCNACGRTFAEVQDKLLGTMRIPEDKAVLALSLLVEGTSIRSIERITGLHRDTVLKLLVMAGERCEKLLEDMSQAVPAQHIEADEIWGYCGMKEKTKKRRGITSDWVGDAYCFIGMERNTKFVHAWHLGRRTTGHTAQFLDKLAMSVEGHFQLDTDGFQGYQDSIRYCIGSQCDHGVIVKHYAQMQTLEARYSPPEVVSVTRSVGSGNPTGRIGTSRIERQNCTLRQRVKRMARLTLAFSKKWENLRAALAVHFAYYNLCAVHKSIRCTPAMEAGIADHIWDMRELLGAGV